MTKVSQKTTSPNGVISLDSTKLRIPLNLVQVSETISGEWVLLNKTTNDELPGFKNKSYSHKLNGITTRFAIENQITANGSLQEYLTIGFNSKALEHDYLTGITKDNIHVVYEYIINTGLVMFGYEDFLNGHVTDTDIKKDLPNVMGKDVVTELIKRSNLVKTGRGATPFRKDINQGIQWSERKTTSFQTAPYLKFYNKTLDLKTQSNIFAETYGIKTSENYWRLELTIKNKKHWKTKEVNDTSLLGILETPQDKLNEFFIQSLKAWLMPRKRQIVKKEGMSPDEHVWYSIIVQDYINEGLTLSDFFYRHLSDLNPSDRSKKKAKIQRIYDMYISDTPKGAKAKKIDEVFETIGYNF